MASSLNVPSLMSNISPVALKVPCRIEKRLAVIFCIGYLSANGFISDPEKIHNQITYNKETHF